MPDMLSTTDGYLDDTGLFDLQAVSTMGLQEEDLEAVLDTEGVQRQNIWRNRLKVYIKQERAMRIPQSFTVFRGRERFWGRFLKSGEFLIRFR